VDGSLTKILVKSGDHVRAGEVLMTIDPLKQQATVDQQRSTEAQKKALYEYNATEVERQRKLTRAEWPASRLTIWPIRPSRTRRLIGSLPLLRAIRSSENLITTT